MVARHQQVAEHVFSIYLRCTGIVGDSTLAASYSLRIMETGQLDKALQGLCMLKSRLASHCLFCLHGCLRRDFL